MTNETIAVYIRVSTQEQSLDRQKKITSEYAQSEFNADLAQLQYYRDKSTGTNTERRGYRDMMDAVRAGEHKAVITTSVSRLARSIRDLDKTVEDIVDKSDTALHIISESFEIRPDEDDPYQKAMFRLLGVFAELEAELAQQRTREGLSSKMESDDYHHGRAPLGFAKEDGTLYEGDQYDEVCAVLDMVQKETLSQRKAAERLDTSRTTIRRALERAELYGI